MKLSIKAGSTSQSLNIFIQDSSSTLGAGLSGLVFNTASLTAYYALPKAASVQITLATLAAITTAYSSGGFKEIDSTNMKGWYRLDLPDAAIASGRFVSIHLQGAANMAPCPIEIELTGWDNQDAVHGGLTSLPNTACTTNASLLTSGTGTDQLSVTTGRVDMGKALGTAVTLDANNVLNVSTKYVGGTLQTARDLGTSVLLSNGTGTGQISLSSGAVLLQATQTGVTIPTVTTVGSVTGAVGSVTGAVGSVTGAVGSVTAAVTLSSGDSPVIVSGTASAGAAGTITLAGASTTANIYNGCLVKTTGGTGSGQVRTITAYSVGRVATIDYNWTTTPDNTTTFAVLATDNAALNSSLQTTAASVQGNVTGSVASVTGAVGSVTGSVGSVTGSVGSISGVTFPTNFSSFSIDASGRVDIAKIKGTASAGTAGYVGLDWSAINAPTTTVGLSGTTISTSQAVASVSGAVGSVTGAVGSVTGSVGSVTGAVGSVTGAVGSVTGNVGGNVVGSVASVTAAVTLSAGDSPVLQSGTAQAGAASTITLASGASATDSLYNGCVVKITSGSGAGQARTITGYVGSTKVATVDYAWTTNPSSSSVYAVLATDNHALNSSLQVTAASVQGNVTGSVASVTGAVGSVTGSVGSVTGAVGSVTGNVGGNVVGTVASVVGAVGSISGVTFPTNFSSFSIDASGRVDVAKIKGTASAGAAGYVGLDWSAINAPTTTVGLTGTTISTSQAVASVSGSVGSVTGAVGSVTGAVGSVTGAVGSVTAAVSLSVNDSPVIVSGTASAGAAGTLTLAGASTTANLYNGCLLKLTGGTGAGQVRTITGYTVGRVATVDYNWTTTPDATTTFAVLAADNAALNSSLQVTSASVQGNVTGSVASVTGAVGSVTGSVGSVTGSVGSINGVTFPTNFSSFSIDASGRVDIAKIKGTASAGAAGYVGLDWANITAPTTTVGLTGTTISSSQAVASVTGAVGSVTGAVGSVTGAVGSVTAAVTLSAGDSPVFYTGTATAGASGTLTDSGASWTVNGLIGCLVKITSGTGTKQCRAIISNTATVLTVDHNWTTTPSSSSVYAITAADNPSLNASLQVATTASDPWGTALPGSYTAGQAGYIIGNNLDAAVSSRSTYAGGAVASVTGAVGSVTGSVGSIAGVTFPTNFSSFSIDASGRVDIAKIKGTASAGAAGYVGLDWATINAPTTTQGLTGTTISSSQAVASVSGAVGSVTGAVASVTGNVGGNVVGTVASVVGAVGSVTGAVGSVTGAVGSVTAAVTLSAGDSPVVQSGTAQAGGASTITLASGASATDHLYEGSLVKITSSTGAGQTRTITGYVGSTKVATVDHAWTTNPSSSSVYAVLATDNPSLNGSLQVATTASDPWGTALPGAYGAGTAGNIIGNNLDAAVSSRSTYAGTDTAGTTTLLSRLTNTRATNLDNLDAAVSTRLASSGYTAPPTAAANATALWQDLTSSSDFTTVGSIGKLLVTDIDAAISSRSTYSGTDTSGTTTLLSRLTNTRSTNLDNLDAAVSTRSTFAGGAVASVSGSVGSISGIAFPAHFNSLSINGSGYVTLASAGLDQVSVESGVNARQALAIIGAACGGKASGLALNAPVFKGMNNTTTRINAVTDADGERSEVTLTLPP